MKASGWNTRVWMRDYFHLLGDFQPDTGQIHLPPMTKEDVYNEMITEFTHQDAAAAVASAPPVPRASPSAHSGVSISAAPLSGRSTAQVSPQYCSWPLGTCASASLATHTCSECGDDVGLCASCVDQHARARATATHGRVRPLPSAASSPATPAHGSALSGRSTSQADTASLAGLSGRGTAQASP